MGEFLHELRTGKQLLGQGGWLGSGIQNEDGDPDRNMISGALKLMERRILRAMGWCWGVFRV